MINREIIGRESDPVKVRVEPEAVRLFTQAVGIPYNGQVPPTFTITFQGGTIPDLNLPERGLIHAGQNFTYHQQIKVGELLTCRKRVKDIFERTGKLGRMTFIVQEIEGHNPVGDLVFTSTSTLIAKNGE